MITNTNAGGLGYDNVRYNVQTPCPADLDTDRGVDFDDLLILLAFWGPCGELCLGDIDGDREVGFDDLLLLLAAWGPCE